MNTQPTQSIKIDCRLESYRSFFDHSWAERIGDLALGAKLQEPVFNLCVNWKAIANAHAMPYIMVQCLSGLTVGLSEGQMPFGLKLIQALQKKLVECMGKSLSNMNRKKLQQCIREIGEEARETLRQHPFHLTPEAFWREYLDSACAEYTLSIWGSQRICYGALYHAYEHLVRECLRLAKGLADYKASNIKEIEKDTRDSFGKTIADICISDRQVAIARHVRNALAHNGGRPNKRLRAIPHGLRVESGILQIRAPDTTNLFNTLKERAYKLVEKGVTLPNMR